MIVEYLNTSDFYMWSPTIKTKLWMMKNILLMCVKRTCKKLIKQKLIFSQTVSNLIFISLSKDIIIVFMRQSQ